MTAQTEAEKKKTAGGAAIKRMQEIAQSIYDTTPGITEDLPRHTSKILQNVKNDKKLPGAAGAKAGAGGA